MLAISLTIACSRYTYDGAILPAHPVRGESHNQRNTTGEVATIPTDKLPTLSEKLMQSFRDKGPICCRSLSASPVSNARCTTKGHMP